MTSSPRRKWRLLCDPPQSGAVNMGIDEAVAWATAQRCVLPTLRLYQWSVPTFSMGAFQKVTSTIAGPARAQALSLVRRITGGLAVYHHPHEVTYSVAVNSDDPVFCGNAPGRIKKMYHTIAEALLCSLERLGVTAGIHANRPSPAVTELCFDENSWFEVTLGDKKLIGSAQKRWKDHALQHGSLMVRPPSPLVDGVVSRNQAALSDLVKGPITVGQIQRAFKEGFEDALGITLELGHLTDSELSHALDLAGRKYSAF